MRRTTASQRFAPIGSSVEYVLPLTMFLFQSTGASTQSSSGKKNGSARTVQPISGSGASFFRYFRNR